ncbi:hypothetical protein RI367_003260 [Sorochytrium milnesiophthora]
MVSTTGSSSTTTSGGDSARYVATTSARALSGSASTAVYVDALTPGFVLPNDYTSPSWPSLYNPLNRQTTGGVFMYYREDIWRFSLIWSVVLFTVVYGAAGCWGYTVFFRRTRWAFLLPVVFLFTAGLVGTLFGSIFGLVIAAVYNAGAFKMSTWTPFLWSLLQVLISVIGAYSRTSTYL